MTSVNMLAGILWLAITAYALLGGADFGGGFWDLTAGTSEGGKDIRARIEHSIGPVWEANHVWLIFALVVVWTAFPPGFAAIASTLFIPLTLVAFGVILRGSGFAFRKLATTLQSQRALGATFALASFFTPFFLGTVAGAIASGRVPIGIAKGTFFTSWLNPTSLLGGVLAVGTCAWLAAVFLTVDARRDGEHQLETAFRKRALISGVVVGIIALSGIEVLNADAPVLFRGLVGRALPLVLLSAMAGLFSLVLLAKRWYRFVRVTAGLAVASIIWGWAVAQYPKILVGGPTLVEAAAPAPTVNAMIWAIVAGAIVLVPSLGYLFYLFNSLSRSAEDSQGKTTKSF